MSTTAPIIDDSAVSESSGSTWRFAFGQIVRGRGDGVKTRHSEERTAITGQLRRVGIYRGESNDQYKKPYEQLEADIETAQGLVFIKSGLLSDEPPYDLKVNRSAIDFAWGLLQFTDPGDTLRITAAQGEAWTNKDGKSMSPSTYVNFSRIGSTPGADGKYPATRIIKPKADKNAEKVPMNDQWIALRKEIEAHPLFAPRTNNRDDDEESGSHTHFRALCDWVDSLGWPTPEEAAADWVETMKGALPEHIGEAATLQDFSDEEWGLALTGLQQRAETLKAEGKPNAVPMLLKAAYDAKQSKAAKPAASFD